MHNELELSLLLYKEEVTFNLPASVQIEIELRSKELNMTKSQYIIYLINLLESNNLDTIKNFRYNLIKRIKKGINIFYIKELIKLRDHLNIILDRL